MSTLAIITARGGSKRIPQKNIKAFCGKPIIAYSIEAALKSEAFDDVMVSTDSEEIAEIAKQYGASVPFLRSEATSNDYATTSDVLREVFDEYEKRGTIVTHACCIYPTAPFATSEKLKNAMDKLINEDVDTVMPVVNFSFPPQRGMAIRDGELKLVSPEYIVARSQDLEPIYHDAGQFYAINVEKFKNSGNVYKGRVLPLVVSELEVQDIDNETDWKLAEMKYALLNK